MKQEIEELPLHDNIRPRNQSSEKRKLIDFIKKQKDKKLGLNGSKKKKQLVGYSTGEWTLRELKLYHRYLSTHKNQFTDPHLRKRNKVFIKLADFIGSRTPDQCRSHHQKATGKFPDFNILLDHYQSKILHLTKMYEDGTNPSIRCIEKEEEKKFKIVQNHFKNRGSIKEEEIRSVELQKQAKIEENEQIKIKEQNVQQLKQDKVTGQVITTNYFKFEFIEQGAPFRIEIESNLMQIFQ